MCIETKYVHVMIMHRRRVNTPAALLLISDGPLFSLCSGCSVRDPGCSVSGARRPQESPRGHATLPELCLGEDTLPGLLLLRDFVPLICLCGAKYAGFVFRSFRGVSLKGKLDEDTSSRDSISFNMKTSTWCIKYVSILRSDLQGFLVLRSRWCLTNVKKTKSCSSKRITHMFSVLCADPAVRLGQIHGPLQRWSEPEDGHHVLHQCCAQ